MVAHSILTAKMKKKPKNSIFEHFEAFLHCFWLLLKFGLKNTPQLAFMGESKVIRYSRELD